MRLWEEEERKQCKKGKKLTHIQDFNFHFLIKASRFQFLFLHFLKDQKVQAGDEQKVKIDNHQVAFLRRGKSPSVLVGGASGTILMAPCCPFAKIVGVYVLWALCIADDDMRNEGAWAALGQSLGFLFSQHTHGSSCLTSDAPKGSLRGTYPVSLLKLDRWAMMRVSIWRHLAPHDAPRPWQRRAMVGRGGFWW